MNPLQPTLETVNRLTSTFNAARANAHKKSIISLDVSTLSPTLLAMTEENYGENPQEIPTVDFLKKHLAALAILPSYQRLTVLQHCLNTPNLDTETEGVFLLFSLKILFADLMPHPILDTFLKKYSEKNTYLTVLSSEKHLELLIRIENRLQNQLSNNSEELTDYLQFLEVLIPDRLINFITETKPFSLDLNKRFFQLIISASQFLLNEKLEIYDGSDACGTRFHYMYHLQNNLFIFLTQLLADPKPEITKDLLKNFAIPYDSLDNFLTAAETHYPNLTLPQSQALTAMIQFMEFTAYCVNETKIYADLLSQRNYNPGTRLQNLMRVEEDLKNLKTFLAASPLEVLLKEAFDIICYYSSQLTAHWWNNKELDQFCKNTIGSLKLILSLHHFIYESYIKHYFVHDLNNDQAMKQLCFYYHQLDNLNTAIKSFGDILTYNVETYDFLAGYTNLSFSSDALEKIKNTLQILKSKEIAIQSQYEKLASEVAELPSRNQAPAKAKPKRKSKTARKRAQKSSSAITEKSIQPFESFNQTLQSPAWLTVLTKSPYGANYELITGYIQKAFLFYQKKKKKRALEHLNPAKMILESMDFEAIKKESFYAQFLIVAFEVEYFTLLTHIDTIQTFCNDIQNFREWPADTKTTFENYDRALGSLFEKLELLDNYCRHPSHKVEEELTSSNAIFQDLQQHLRNKLEEVKQNYIQQRDELSRKYLDLEIDRLTAIQKFGPEKWQNNPRPKNKHLTRRENIQAIIHFLDKQIEVIDDTAKSWESFKNRSPFALTAPRMYTARVKKRYTPLEIEQMLNAFKGLKDQNVSGQNLLDNIHTIKKSTPQEKLEPLLVASTPQLVKKPKPLTSQDLENYLQDPHFELPIHILDKDFFKRNLEVMAKLPTDKQLSVLQKLLNSPGMTHSLEEILLLRAWEVFKSSKEEHSILEIFFEKCFLTNAHPKLFDSNKKIFLLAGIGFWLCSDSHKPGFINHEAFLERLMALQGETFLRDFIAETTSNEFRKHLKKYILFMFIEVYKWAKHRQSIVPNLELFSQLQKHIVLLLPIFIPSIDQATFFKILEDNENWDQFLTRKGANALEFLLTVGRLVKQRKIEQQRQLSKPQHSEKPIMILRRGQTLSDTMGTARSNPAKLSSAHSAEPSEVQKKWTTRLFSSPPPLSTQVKIKEFHKKIFENQSVSHFYERETKKTPATFTELSPLQPILGVEDKSVEITPEIKTSEDITCTLFKEKIAQYEGFLGEIPYTTTYEKNSKKAYINVSSSLSEFQEIFSFDVNIESHTVHFIIDNVQYDLILQLASEASLSKTQDENERRAPGI